MWVVERERERGGGGESERERGMKARNGETVGVLLSILKDFAVSLFNKVDRTSFLWNSRSSAFVNLIKAVNRWKYKNDRRKKEQRQKQNYGMETRKVRSERIQQIYFLICENGDAIIIIIIIIIIS